MQCASLTPPVSGYIFSERETSSARAGGQALPHARSLHARSQRRHMLVRDVGITQSTICVRSSRSLASSISSVCSRRLAAVCRSCARSAYDPLDHFQSTLHHTCKTDGANRGRACNIADMHLRHAQPLVVLVRVLRHYYTCRIQISWSTHKAAKRPQYIPQSVRYAEGSKETYSYGKRGLLTSAYLGKELLNALSLGLLLSREVCNERLRLL